MVSNSLNVETNTSMLMLILSHLKLHLFVGLFVLLNKELNI